MNKETYQNNLQQERQAYEGIRSTIKEKTPTLSLPNFSAHHCGLHNKSVTTLAKELAMQY